MRGAQLSVSKSQRVGDRSKTWKLPPGTLQSPRTRAGPEPGTISPRGGAQGRSSRTRPTGRSVACCFVGAAAPFFLAQPDKRALIGQRDPAVVGRKESSRLIGCATPAMRQAAAGVASGAAVGSWKGAAGCAAAIFTSGSAGTRRQGGGRLSQGLCDHLESGFATVVLLVFSSTPLFFFLCISLFLAFFLLLPRFRGCVCVCVCAKCRRRVLLALCCEERGLP